MSYKVIDYVFDSRVYMNKNEFVKFVRTNTLIEFVSEKQIFTIYNGIPIFCE